MGTLEKERGSTWEEAEKGPPLPSSILLLRFSFSFSSLFICFSFSGFLLELAEEGLERLALQQLEETGEEIEFRFLPFKQVRESPSKASTPIVTCQCVPSVMNADPFYSQGLNCAVLSDESIKNRVFHPSNFPPCCQSLDGHTHRPVNLFKSRNSVVPEIASRHSMRIQDDKENHCDVNSSEQGQKPLSNLGSCLPSDKVNLSFLYKHQVQLANFVCPNCEIFAEDQIELDSARVEYKRDGRFFPRDVITSSYGYPPLPTFRTLPIFFRTSLSSKFLRPAQQLLDEVVCVSNAVQFGPDKLLKGNKSDGIFAKHGGRSTQLEQSTKFINRDLIFSNQSSAEENNHIHIRIIKLVVILDELEERYKQYCQQIGVVTSFEVIAGTGAAKSYIALAIQAISRHFLNLRFSITTQIQNLKEPLSEEMNRKYEAQISFFNQNARKDRVIQPNRGMLQVQQVWRPIRGLPENSVSILPSWLLEHFLHPYPNDHEKPFLASQTGLTKNQISNWFINAHFRLWKPMIEEMYREELSDASGDSNACSSKMTMTKVMPGK